jgi:hypothetical protein
VTLGAPPPTLDTLEPGGTITLHQTLPVNIVFVGYEAEGADPDASDVDVNESDFRDGLASTYQAINRFPAFSPTPSPAAVVELQRRYPHAANVGKFILAWREPGDSTQAAPPPPR